MLCANLVYHFLKNNKNSFCIFGQNLFEFVSHGISNLLLQNKTVRPAEGGAGILAQNSLAKTGSTAWACLTHAHSLFLSKPFSSFKVPEVGIEPTSLARHDFKSCAYTSSATRAKLFWHFCHEAWGGIEPPHRDFADLCLTTWLPGRVILS